MFWLVAERSGGSSLQDRAHRLGGRVAMERALARQHLVKNRAKREYVRSGIGRLALHLLGRHIAERSHDDAGLGSCRRRRQVRLRTRAALGLSQLCQTEVEDLDSPVFGDEEVLGLQIPMHDSLLVRGSEPVRDLQSEVDRLARGKGAASEAGAQRLPFEKLRDDVRRVVVRADVVDSGDVRDGSGFPRRVLPARSGGDDPRLWRAKPEAP